MERQFRLRHVNEITGAFVLLTLATVVAAVIFSGTAQRWFTPVRALTIRLPEEGSLGLKKGAEVIILGTVAGSVDDIAVNLDGRMQAKSRIRADFFRFLRVDSKAVIGKTLGFAGDAYIEITKGSGDELPEKGAAIDASSSASTSELMTTTLNQLRDEVVPAVKEIRQGIAQFTSLVAELRDPEGDLRQTLGHARRITLSIEKGDGLAGKLISDPKLALQADAVLPRIQESLDEMREILKDIHRTTAGLPELARSMHRTSEALPGLVLQTHETMRQLQILIEGLQRHWLVRSYVVPDEPARPIAPEETGGGSAP